MTEPLFYIDQSDIRDGQREAVKRAIPELVAFIDQHVPKAIAYHICLDPTETSMTVLQIQPDSASLEDHMTVGAPAFARFKDLIRLRSIDLYGTPSPHLRQLLEDKARTLGGASVTVHDLQAGFVRLAAAGQ